ncbi:hypothetical protein S245_071176 [Arachis hypogaea]
MVLDTKVIDDEKDRMAIQEVFLNDLNFNYSNLNNTFKMIDSVSYTKKNEKEDYRGYNLNEEVGSERTVTQGFDMCGGGVVHGDTRNCGFQQMGYSFKCTSNLCKGGCELGLGVSGLILKRMTHGPWSSGIQQVEWENEEGAETGWMLGQEVDGLHNVDRVDLVGAEPGQARGSRVTKKPERESLRNRAPLMQDVRGCPATPGSHAGATGTDEPLEQGPWAAAVRGSMADLMLLMEVRWRCGWRG